MKWLPDRQVETGTDHDHRVVAVDGGRPHGASYLTWAAVTGAGWVRFGRTAGQNVAAAELAAIVEGLKYFPVNTSVTLLCDSQSVVEIVNRIQAAGRRRKNGRKRSAKARNRSRKTQYRVWIPVDLREALAHELAELKVHASWRPRNSNNLMKLAHDFTQEGRYRGGTPAWHDTPAYRSGQRSAAELSSPDVRLLPRRDDPEPGCDIRAGLDAGGDPHQVPVDVGGVPSRSFILE